MQVKEDLELFENGLKILKQNEGIFPKLGDLEKVFIKSSLNSDFNQTLVRMI